MRIPNRQWLACRRLRCANLKDNANYAGVQRECNLEECQYPDKRAAFVGCPRAVVEKRRLKEVLR